MEENKLEFDYSKLLGRIKEKFGTQDNLAAKTTMSVTSLNYKLNNKLEWKQKEIVEVTSLLDIAPEEIKDYFFTLKVEKTQ